jgi:hypothetical protein
MLSRDALEELGSKYREMLAMRLEHEAGNEDVARVRERMARLASRFPGALREIDELALEAIRERLRRIEAVIDGIGALAPWMEATASFHALARGALWTKRWLGGRKTVDPDMLREFASVAPADVARDWADRLETVASPPGGRLTDLVFQRVARLLGTSVEDVRDRVLASRRGG